jgi:uncharacterized RDD family membrane protein YckC
MICPHCAFPNDPGTRVCKKCHRPVGAAATDESQPESSGSQADGKQSPDWLGAPASVPPALEAEQASLAAALPPQPDLLPADEEDSDQAAKTALTTQVDSCLAEARQKEKSGDLRGAFLICQSLLIDNYGDLPEKSLASLYEYMAQVSQLQGKSERADKYRRKAKSLRPSMITAKEAPITDSPGKAAPIREKAPTSGAPKTPAPLKTDRPAVSEPAPNSSIEKALSSVVESRAHEPLPEDEAPLTKKEEPDLEQVPAMEEEEPKTAPMPDESPEIQETSAGSGGRLIWVAGFWPRCAAFFLDTLIVTCVVITMILLSSVLLGDRATSGFLFFAQKMSTLMLALLIYTFFLVAYLTLFARYGGQSAGKMIMGIRVVGLDGHTISTLQAIRRAIGMLLSAFVGLAGFLWTAFDLKRRGWHDYIGGTIVVYVHPKVKSVSSLP